MNDSRAVPVRDLIPTAGPGISGLATVAKQIQACNRVLKSKLDAPLRDHVKVANIAGDRLVVQCDTPAWSARARLVVPRLLESINHDLERPPFRQVRIITRPDPDRVTSPAPRPEPLSEQTRRLLEEVASGLENPALRRALYRLARRDT